MLDYSTQREHMVETQIRRRGIRDARVLDAVGKVSRELFVPDALRALAYDDAPLDIGQGQTISQPFIVAMMVEALELGPSDRVLEIGTGSGYAAAVLAEIALEVDSVERIASLASRAKRTLQKTGYDNVRVHCGDGTLGYPEGAPYDAILVSAGGPDIPQALLDQLGTNGCLVMPVGENQREQKLIRVRMKRGGKLHREELGMVRFVPLIGAQGWVESQTPIAQVD